MAGHFPTRSFASPATHELALNGATHMDPRLNFGLGKSGDTDSITIRWPDGETAKFSDVRGDRFVVYEHPARAVSIARTH